MKYDFDKIISRKNTGAIKWDMLETLYDNQKVLPMWVADMDLPCPEPVIKRLKKRLDHPLFGYTMQTERYNQAIIDWMKKRFDWQVDAGRVRVG